MGEEFQRAGTAKMYREAVHSKWLPPLSLCVHFRKDFALKSGLYPLICCECRIIYKSQNIDNELLKKSNICLKKFVQGVSPGKKIPAQAVREKKNSYQLKIPHTPHHFSNGPSLRRARKLYRNQ